MTEDETTRARWTSLDVLRLIASRGDKGAALPGVADEHDLMALRQMAKRGWITLTEFGVPHARITEAGKRCLTAGERNA